MHFSYSVLPPLVFPLFHSFLITLESSFTTFSSPQVLNSVLNWNTCDCCKHMPKQTLYRKSSWKLSFERIFQSQLSPPWQCKHFRSSNTLLAWKASVQPLSSDWDQPSRTHAIFSLQRWEAHPAHWSGRYMWKRLLGSEERGYIIPLSRTGL